MNWTSSESHTFTHTAVNKAASQLYKPVKIHGSSSWFTASSASYCSTLLAQMLNIQLCTVGSKTDFGCRPSLSQCLCFTHHTSPHLSACFSYSNPHPVCPVPCPFSHLDYLYFTLQVFYVFYEGSPQQSTCLHLYRPPLSRQPSAGPASPFLLKMLQTGTRAQTRSAQVSPSLCRWA